MRLIDADKMINLIDRVIAEKETLTYEEYAGSSLIASTKIEKGHLKFMKILVNNQPVVALCKTGYWMSNRAYYDNGKTPMVIYCKCSNCGETAYEKSNYCPNCGADMR